MTAFRPDHVMTFQELDALHRQIRAAACVMVWHAPLRKFFTLAAAPLTSAAGALHWFANAFRDFDNAVNIGGPIAVARKEAQRAGAAVQERITQGLIRLEYGPPAPPPAVGGRQQ